MRIGVIGAGGLGGTLARQLAKLGHQVLLANSRGPESLTALAAEIGATPVSVLDAAKATEIVIISIPTKTVTDLPRGLFATVPGSVVVVDTGNYHPELRDGRIGAIDRGMLDSEWVAQQLGRPVIKAFNNITANSLLEKGMPRGTTGRIALPVAGDPPDAKAAVLRLVDDLGFDPVDGGELDNSWRQQPGTPAYCRDLDAAALRCALADADRSRIADYRAEEEQRIRRQIAAQTPRGSAPQSGSQPRSHEAHEPGVDVPEVKPGSHQSHARHQRLDRAPRRVPQPVTFCVLEEIMANSAPGGANDYNAKIIEEFRANEGRVGGPWAGTTLILVHHLGAKSGIQRVTPLACFPQGDDRWVVQGSNGGSSSHPDWSYNLKANPRTTVEVGTQTFTVLAQELDEVARAELWPKLVEAAPQLGEHQARTTRQIPVFMLTRQD